MSGREVVVPGAGRSGGGEKDAAETANHRRRYMSASHAKHCAVLCFRNVRYVLCLYVGVGDLYTFRQFSR